MYNIYNYKRRRDTMQKGTGVEFKSLLTQEEYEKLINRFKGNRTDFQTNHYFDTPRFSLKALDTSLRIRERESLELTLKRKKGYSVNETTVSVTVENLNEIRETGIIAIPEITNELTPLIGEQKVVNFLSLATHRTYLQYGNGVLFIDKSEYLGVTDYELDYEAASYHQGKKEFIELISDLEIQYKKSEKKIKRAYNAFKRLN
jgi:uncharacterized protein YjbK